ncbi:MAG: TRAP transporter large permease subunit [bacterium]|nr:TRAP transporter large permease subunit [bacterium]
MSSETARDGASTSRLVRTFACLAGGIAVLSAIYHIAAVYLVPLPGELHPNMHLLFAYSIILIGGAAAKPEVYGDEFGGLGPFACMYFVSLLIAAFFFFYVMDEFSPQEKWADGQFWWAYALPFVSWAAMFIRERAWKAMGLWAASFVPAVLLFANWSSLPASAQQPTSWWILLASAVPAGWLLFGVFHRPAEGVRRAAVPLAVMVAAALLAAWRVGLWAYQSNDVRTVLYLWPLLILLVPAIWAWRRAQDIFQEHPGHPFPRSLDVGMDTGMLVFAVGAGLYVFYAYGDMANRVGAPTFTDTRSGFIMIAVAIELTRRCFGPPLPILVVVTVLYGLWGNLFHPPFGHGGHGWIELIGKLSTDFIGGVFGFLVIISATFIMMFLILGAFLHESGAGQFFVNFALGLFGRLRAGAGLAAVGSSALMGTVSGSAAGNVVTTGTFTIPLMKRIGLSPHIAAAAEAAASSGGQIMPPVMGAGAFIMSELIEVPYVHLIGYAAIPAVLYFIIVGINIHFAAGKLNIKPLPREEIPDWRAELRSGWFYLVPLAFLVYFLMEGRTPVYAGVMAIFTMILIWFYRFSAAFLATMRVGDRFVTDEGYVFVPIMFWAFSVVLYSVLYAAGVWMGWPLFLDLPLTAGNAAAAAAILGVAGTGAGVLSLRLLPAGRDLWHEIARGWPVIYPLAAVILWAMYGWTSGVAGAGVVLAVLAAWSGLRGIGVRTFALSPWIFFLIWGAAYGVQRALYTILPGFEEAADYLHPFGFIYHAIIFFAVGAAIQRAILAFSSPREPGDETPPRLDEVAAISCNPLLYLARARREGRTGPDTRAAEGATGWLDDLRRALATGGRQGAEFGVTLLSIEIVVQVLSFTGVGNKFALLIESLSRDICLIGLAPGGGCIGYLGLDGFFVGLLLTAVACAILGMGMPTTAAYVLLAILGGPVLIKLIGPELTAIYGEEWMKHFLAIRGDKVAAHMFIFYFAILSAITPPVAIASLVAAKLAGASYFQTSIMALRFAIVGFVVPFLFMYQPSLLALDHPARVVLATLMTLIGFVAFSAGVQGWFLDRLYFYERMLFFGCFLFLIFFDIYFRWPLLAAGVACAVPPVVRQCRARVLQRAAA